MNVNRTALAAAASITAVVLAGTAALAANFGILSSTDDGIDSSITPTVVASTVTPLSGTGDGVSSAPELFAYQVEGVGVVTLERQDETLGLSSVDVDGSVWSWSEDDGDDSDDGVAVRFASDSAIMRFSATLEDGQIIVDVVDETPIGDDHDSGMADDEDDEDDVDHDSTEREDDSGSVEDDD